MAFGLCTQNVRSHDRPIGLLQGSWGWWTDGSLRALGEFCVPAQVHTSRAIFRVLQPSVLCVQDGVVYDPKNPTCVQHTTVCFV